jgi:hypothetical protein
MELLLFLAINTGLVALSQTTLIEMNGFHCMMQHSFKMNRKTHGKPRITEPPFEFTVEDTEGNTIKYYEPGQVYVGESVYRILTSIYVLVCFKPNIL